MLNHAGFSFSSLQCVFGTCICVTSLPLNRFPYSSNIPLFIHSFFSVFTHRNVNLRTHCRGEERDFPSLIHLFPSSLPLLNHFRLLLSLSVFLCALLFSPYALTSIQFLQAHTVSTFIGCLLVSYCRFIGIVK